MIYSKANQFKFGVPSINFLGDTAGKDATQDHEASWTINPINNTDNTHSGILATRISSSFIAIFGQIQPSWALSRFWQVCRHLFLVQHQPFRSACPTCQRALGSPQTQSHVEIKFKDSKRWIFDLKNPDIIENHRNSWVNFMQIRKVSNIRMKVIDSQLRLPGLPAVGQPLYPKNFQKSRLKHLYVLRTTSTSMAGSNLLQNPKFTEKFSHQLSTQRFRRSFSCIQRWKQKFQKKITVFPIPLSPPWSSWHCFWRTPICAHLWWHLPIYHFSHPSSSPTPDSLNGGLVPRRKKGNVASDIFFVAPSS